MSVYIYMRHVSLFNWSFIPKSTRKYKKYEKLKILNFGG